VDSPIDFNYRFFRSRQTTSQHDMAMLELPRLLALALVVLASQGECFVEQQ
jgi:hypothetical protein